MKDVPARFDRHQLVEQLREMLGAQAEREAFQRMSTAVGSGDDPGTLLWFDVWAQLSTPSRRLGAERAAG